LVDWSVVSCRLAVERRLARGRLKVESRNERASKGLLALLDWLESVGSRAAG